MIALAQMLFAAEPAAAPDPLLAEMQQLELSRNAAIKAGDMAALEQIYAPDFHGIAAGGARVDRDTLFAVFRRNAGGTLTADSKVLSARAEGPLLLVEGRLKLSDSKTGALVSDSHYLHIFRRNGPRWEMIEGAAVPIPPPTN